MKQKERETRLTKFNEDTCSALFKAITKGLNVKLACGYAGVSYWTVRRWRSIALRDMEEGKHTEYTDFYTKFKMARSYRAEKWIEMIESAAPKDWRAAAWLLEKNERCHFSDNAVLDDFDSEEELEERNDHAIESIEDRIKRVNATLTAARDRISREGPQRNRNSQSKAD